MSASVSKGGSNEDILRVMGTTKKILITIRKRNGKLLGYIVGWKGLANSTSIGITEGNRRDISHIKREHNCLSGWKNKYHKEE